MKSAHCHRIVLIVLDVFLYISGVTSLILVQQSSQRAVHVPHLRTLNFAHDSVSTWREVFSYTVQSPPVEDFVVWTCLHTLHWPVNSTGNHFVLSTPGRIHVCVRVCACRLDAGQWFKQQTRMEIRGPPLGNLEKFDVYKATFFLSAGAKLVFQYFFFLGGGGRTPPPHP